MSNNTAVPCMGLGSRLHLPLFGAPQLFFFFNVIIIINYFYFYYLIVCLLVNSFMTAVLPSIKCQKEKDAV